MKYKIKEHSERNIWQRGEFPFSLRLSQDGRI